MSDSYIMKSMTDNGIRILENVNLNAALGLKKQ